MTPLLSQVDPDTLEYLKCCAYFPMANQEFTFNLIPTFAMQLVDSKKKKERLLLAFSSPVLKIIL